eukprot:3155794-Amphidinium_carterae.1
MTTCDRLSTGTLKQRDDVKNLKNQNTQFGQASYYIQHRLGWMTKDVMQKVENDNNDDKNRARNEGSEQALRKTTKT